MPMSEERFAAAAAPPSRIHRLHELSIDLWWSWDARARDLFRRLDYGLWRHTAHNPVKMLQQITPERLRQAAAMGGAKKRTPPRSTSATPCDWTPPSSAARRRKAGSSRSIPR